MKTAKIRINTPEFNVRVLSFLGGISLLLIANPASAHHAFGGKTPSNILEGFLAGIAHPVIGLDHFAFVVAIGLLAALKQRGIFIPVAFILAALAGTGIHLMGFNLPTPELFISASVLGCGVMLARKEYPNLVRLITLAALAGIFHGYAYGEAIVGAEMTSLTAYLVGFTVIQLAISFVAFWVSKSVIKQFGEEPKLPLRFAGFAIGGAGAVFLSSAILG
ncbi:HupE/UreJ family protein [Lyngbya aestuarii]|uniref:HupE/UreJ family protein n=1 Tax=Lyngbya aestuarii TaxID=118322 RepID=UPI00403DF53B